MLRRQQVSLMRVLARQLGKNPSELMYDEKRKEWYCVTDTQMQQDKQQNLRENFYKQDYITPEIIKRDTSDLGLKEINDLAQEIKQPQNKIEKTDKQLSE